MKIDILRLLLSAKIGASEELPFGPEALVFKVAGKMFALLGWDEDPLRITLKCESALALELRELYPAIQPGYYMNKNHWNTITLDGTVSDELLQQMIDASYMLVVKSLTKAQQASLNLS